MYYTRTERRDLYILHTRTGGKGLLYTTKQGCCNIHKKGKDFYILHENGKDFHILHKGRMGRTSIFYTRIEGEG